MSDCFDHEVDAWDQYIGYNGASDWPYRRQPDASIIVIEVRAATNKAILFYTQGGLCWIPRSQILKFEPNKIIIPYWLKSKLHYIYDNPS